jgi:hypothetical protein
MTEPTESSIAYTRSRIWDLFSPNRHFRGQIPHVRGRITAAPWQSRRVAWADDALARSARSIAWSVDHDGLVSWCQRAASRRHSADQSTEQRAQATQRRTRTTSHGGQSTHLRSQTTSHRGHLTTRRRQPRTHCGQAKHTRTQLVALE